MPSAESEELLPCKEQSHINTLPTEIFEMIIREYAIVSVTLQRNLPMNFLLVCRLWGAIGKSRQHLFTPHLIVNGRHEMEQLLTLYERNQIHPTITRLTVNLAPVYVEEPLESIARAMPTMRQIVRDLERLRGMISKDWVIPKYGAPSYWDSLRLEQFSLVVDLSAISARKPLFEAWTRSWVSKLSRQWRNMGWTGSEGIYRGGRYSYWDR